MDLSPRQARAVAASGYVFLIPLVMGYAAMYAEAIDPSSPGFGGGFGRWIHHRSATSYESDVSRSHVTRLYSITWLDVRGEPWIFPVPTIGVPSTTRVTDLWGYVVEERTEHGTEIGPLVIAADDWVGAIPPEARGVARGESPFVRCELRAELHEHSDLAQVRAIQRTYRIEPLSAWTGRPAAPPEPAITWWPCPPQTLTSIDFWTLGSFALSLTVPAPDDRGILDRLAEIGVVPGGRWDPNAFDPDVARAIEDGMDDAITELMRAADGPWDPARPGSRDDADRDYFGRALAALRSNPLPDLGQRDPTSFV